MTCSYRIRINASQIEKMNKRLKLKTPQTCADLSRPNCIDSSRTMDIYPPKPQLPTLLASSTLTSKHIYSYHNDYPNPRLSSHRPPHPLLQYACVNKPYSTELTPHTGWTARVEAVLEYFQIPHTHQFVKLSEVQPIAFPAHTRHS